LKRTLKTPQTIDMCSVNTTNSRCPLFTRSTKRVVLPPLLPRLHMYSTECIPPLSLHCTSSWSAACGQYDTFHVHGSTSSTSYKPPSLYTAYSHTIYM